MGVEFTIIIPVYNDPGRVGRAIRSVLEQTMPDFELIVLDDCSTEQIAEVVNTFQDERLRLIRNDRNLGCGANKNKGLWLASAPLFKPLDSDDWLEPGCLEKMLETFQRNPAVALVTVAATEHQETIPQKTRPRKNPGPNNRYGLCSGRSFQELYFQGKSAGNPSQVA